MLLTNKADILEAMNKELERASASSIEWLADIFNVPLTQNREGVVISVSPAVRRYCSWNAVSVTGFRGTRKIKYSRKNSDVIPVFVSYSGKRYVLPLIPDSIPQLEEQIKTFVVKSRNRKNKYSEHRKTKRRLTHI